MVDKPTPTPRRGYLYHKALSMAEEQEAKPGELRGAASRPAPPCFGSVSCRAAAALVRGKGPERFGVFPSENGSVGIGLDGGVIWPPPHSSGKRFASRKSTIVRRLCDHFWGEPSGVLAQSKLRIRALISPPLPAKLNFRDYRFSLRL